MLYNFSIPPTPLLFLVNHRTHNICGWSPSADWVHFSFSVEPKVNNDTSPSPLIWSLPLLLVLALFGHHDRGSCITAVASPADMYHIESYYGFYQVVLCSAMKWCLIRTFLYCIINRLDFPIIFNFNLLCFYHKNIVVHHTVLSNQIIEI